ncbi:unnamed protein product [Vitrella brassicaformis CCMP3155]|uniref:Uncharacterized protein n=1 Tax=Vitrella brassicaformis (strain CCMP3155) TaxID=1169540 RepID=A0A0G4ELU4_VITBC|nr:unnamed protein product [Vitrella brassicaformis CCMP3155]|eukprot:CEL98087.1 unnamed protein product [Vitrella brassicaformis CCMP3155]
MPSFAREQQVFVYGAAPALNMPQPFHRHQHPQQHPPCMWPTPPPVPIRPIERHPAHRRCKPPARKPPRPQHTRGAPWRTRVNPFVCPPCLRARQDQYGATAAPIGAHAPPAMPAPPHLMQQHIRQPPPIAASGASAVHAPGWGFVPPAAAMAPHRAPQTAAAPQRHAVAARPNIAAILMATTEVPAASNAREGEGRVEERREREEEREREGEEAEEDRCRTMPAMSHQRQQEEQERAEEDEEEDDRAPPSQLQEEDKDAEGREEDKDVRGEEAVHEPTGEDAEEPAAGRGGLAPSPQQEGEDRERAEDNEEEEGRMEAVAAPPTPQQEDAEDDEGREEEQQHASQPAQPATTPAPVQQPRSSKKIALGEHHFTTTYFFNDRSVSLRATLRGTEVLVKFVAPDRLLRALQVPEALIADEMEKVQRLMGIEDEAQLLHRLEGQLGAPRLLSRGYVDPSEAVAVRLPAPNERWRCDGEGTGWMTLMLSGPFYAIEIMKFRGIDAPNLVEVTLARAAIATLTSQGQAITPTVTVPPCFSLSRGKPLKPVIVTAVQALARTTIHVALLKALTAMHHYHAPKALHELKKEHTEEAGYPPKLEPYSDMLSEAYWDVAELTADWRKKARGVGTNLP